MKAKTCKRASGGEVKPYDAAGSNEEREAKERKRGGRVEKSKKEDRKVEGEKPKMRLDRPKRASGGRVGSDKDPFTSARNESDAKGHKASGFNKNG